MSSFKNLLGKVILEIPAVIIAVFLALAVNNCNQERQLEKAAKKTLEAILLEVESNKSSLANNIKDNKQNEEAILLMKDSMELNINGKWEANLQLGYEQTFLSTAAWEMAQITGATQQFDAAMVQQLSLIYDLQEMYIEQGDHFFKQMASVDFHLVAEQSPKAQLEATLALIRIAESIGMATIEQYDQFIKAYQ